MQSKNLIGAADLEWIFACNHEGLSLFFINHKVIFDYLFKSSYMPV